MTKELDDLLLKLNGAVNAGARIDKAVTDQLAGAGYVNISNRGHKRKVSLSEEGRHRIHDIGVEKAEALSVASVKAFIHTMQTSLLDFVIEVPDPWDTFEDYLQSWRHSICFFVWNRADGTRVVIRLRERMSQGTPYSAYRSSPLQQWDVTVGDWNEAVRFRSRKSGFPVDDIAKAVVKQMADGAKKAAAALEEEAQRGSLQEMVDAVHDELGLFKNDVRAHLVVEDNGDLRLRLPRFSSFEQAVALLRAAHKEGL